MKHSDFHRVREFLNAPHRARSTWNGGRSPQALAKHHPLLRQECTKSLPNGESFHWDSGSLSLPLSFRVFQFLECPLATTRKRLSAVPPAIDRSARSSNQVLTRLHFALPSNGRSGQRRLRFPTLVLATEEARRRREHSKQLPEATLLLRKQITLAEFACRKRASTVAFALHSKTTLCAASDRNSLRLLERKLDGQ